MKCFRCPDPVLDMVQVNDYELVCPLCNLRFDYDHAQHIEKELSEIGYMSFSNEELVDKVKEYLDTKFQKVGLVKSGISQWLYIDERGKEAVKKVFIQRKEQLETELKKVSSILQGLE